MSILPRAITFNTFGPPHKVLKVKSLPPLPTQNDLAPSQAIIKFIKAPVNPSDINVIQGIYPSKPLLSPQGHYIPGNEGLARILHLPPNHSSNLSIGDWAIMRKPQSGTWASHSLVNQHDLLPLPTSAKSVLSATQAATLSVNPPTALRILSDFLTLSPGDYFLQNAANSSVGRAAIQISNAKGINSINFIRNRLDLHRNPFSVY